MLLLFLPRVRTLCRSLKFNYCTSSNAPANVEMEKTKNNKNIVWIDMEMSGLDEEKDKILEVACLVTDDDLNIISEEIDLVIHQPDEVLNGMDSWCTRVHKASGLTKASKESKTTIEEAESKILKIIQQYTQPKTSPLAGNSVYVDRFFLKKNMPMLEDYLHYRIIDVSTIKELAKRWNPTVYDAAIKKSYSHRALDDIKESIQELQNYKNNFLVLKK